MIGSSFIEYRGAREFLNTRYFPAPQSDHPVLDMQVLTVCVTFSSKPPLRVFDWQFYC